MGYNLQTYDTDVWTSVRSLTRIDRELIFVSIQFDMIVCFVVFVSIIVMVRITHTKTIHNHQDLLGFLAFSSLSKRWKRHSIHFCLRRRFWLFGANQRRRNWRWWKNKTKKYQLEEKVIAETKEEENSSTLSALTPTVYPRTSTCSSRHILTTVFFGYLPVVVTVSRLVHSPLPSLTEQEMKCCHRHVIPKTVSII